MPSSLSTFLNPPTEFSVLPFWFWNDDLDADEIRRQIADFEEHGVYGFIIHPRVGLPRGLGWMSDALLEFYDVAIEEAGRRGMQVVLYDEGMYPSGSSAGQVVAENPGYQTRCLEARGLAVGEEPMLQPDEKLVAVVSRRGGGRLAVIDRKMDAYIRGLHYIDGGPAEDEPLAGDLLNPEAVACFIRLVYDKFYERFGQHFGGLIPAIFTDEPSPVGKPRERGVWPGTTGILAHVNRLLGYDFTPHLAALWHDDEPDADRYRADYERAIALRMEETWYAQLYDWCTGHGIALTGHPAKADDLGAERYFHMPGQDIVWRWVLPDDPTALEGAQSTQGKCGSSAMIHTGRRRNANELCGAFGHGLTWEEMNWLADWCFVRGTNMLFPHAFYYSVRGIRWDERPPDVGPNNAWWGRYKSYADRCRRLCWLNTDSQTYLHGGHPGQGGLAAVASGQDPVSAAARLQLRRGAPSVGGRGRGRERHPPGRHALPGGAGGARAGCAGATGAGNAGRGRPFAALRSADAGVRTSGLCRWIGCRGCQRRTGGGGTAGAPRAKGWTGLVDAVQ